MLNMVTFDGFSVCHSHLGYNDLRTYRNMLNNFLLLNDSLNDADVLSCRHFTATAAADPRIWFDQLCEIFNPFFCEFLVRAIIWGYLEINFYIYNIIF